MTEDELERLTDVVLRYAARANSPEIQEQWDFNRQGIKEAIVLHVSIIRALNEVPISQGLQ